MSIQQKINQRKTFAIISHPDAGKTTLTEKLLLLGGAIHLAGSVKSRKSKKFATSDWMELEKQRGISVSSSVLRFEYENYICNILDTPGHQDFSEDTYRTLTAADAAIMLIDAAKGVEPQTIKLFQVCRMRRIPIITFVNKLDRPSKAVLEILENIEQVLHIPAIPFNIPFGSGEHFHGILDLESHAFHAFQGTRSTTQEVSSIVFADFTKENAQQFLPNIPQFVHNDCFEELELLQAAGVAFDKTEFLKGNMTPVFFGSAMTFFGLRLFLDHFLRLVPPPKDFMTQNHEIVGPSNPQLSGFIFKIQANMDPKHRDRVAFFRIVSGCYIAGEEVYHHRLGRMIKLAPPQEFFANDRQFLEVAYPGDIVGIYDSGLFAIGDTLGHKPWGAFPPLPCFAPELFAYLKTKNSLKKKQLLEALKQLCQEGIVQLFFNDYWPDPVVGTVGVLQFEVLSFRLQNEYNIEVVVEMAPIYTCRWLDAYSTDSIEEKFQLQPCTDSMGNLCYLFKSQFTLEYFQNQNPDILLWNSSIKRL
jgi:peptide chain release factor 3